MMPVQEPPSECPVCREGTELALLFNKRREFSLFECAHCAAQFWMPFRNPGREWYEAQEQYRGDDPRLYRGYHLAFLELLTSLPTPLAILDIGCGTGELVAELEKRGHLVWGVDQNHRNIEIARRHWGLKNLNAASFKEFFARKDLPRFDVVTFFEVLEHLDDPADFARSVQKLLKPGGRIVMSVPSRERFLPNLYEWDFPPHHLTRWNELALERFFSRIDFEIASVRYVDQYIHFKELFSGLTRGVAEASKRVKGGYRIQALFLQKLPAFALRGASLLSKKKNGVMVVELSARSESGIRDKEKIS